MRLRNRLLLFVVTTLLASALGTLAALVTTPGTAQACSIVAPWAEATPATGLTPGQTIELVGWGFYNIEPVEPMSQPAPVPGPDGAVLGPVTSCDFALSPMTDLDVHWRGDTSAWLGSVSGPDFATRVVVPAHATPGPARITVGPMEVAVWVGDTSVLPPECPLTARPGGIAHHVCPDPCAYLEPTALAAQSDAARSDAALWCPPPGPCPVFGADAVPAQSDAALWCPPPEPCPVFGADVAQSDAALWCPPPEPCHFFADGEQVDDQRLWPECPEPCPAFAVDAVESSDLVWCPPPEPCPAFGADAAQSDAALWCPPPEPCHFLTAGDVVEDQGLWAECPEPCFGLPTDGVWCPPGPCRLVGGDALICPDEHNAAPELSSPTSPAPVPQIEPATAASPPQPIVPLATTAIQPPEPAIALEAATQVIADVTWRLRTMAEGIKAIMFG